MDGTSGWKTSRIVGNALQTKPPRQRKYRRIGLVSGYLNGFSENAREPSLERRLSESGFRRIALPETFLATDEMLLKTKKIVDGLMIVEPAIERNLNTYGPFFFSTRLMDMAVQRGANRGEMHEAIRIASMQAWDAVQRGEANPLIPLLAADSKINVFLSHEEVQSEIDPRNQVGNAPEKSRVFAEHIRSRIAPAG